MHNQALGGWVSLPGLCLASAQIRAPPASGKPSTDFLTGPCFSLFRLGVCSSCLALLTTPGWPACFPYRVSLVGLHFNPRQSVLAECLHSLSLWGVTPGLCLHRRHLCSPPPVSCQPAASALPALPTHFRAALLGCSILLCWVTLQTHPTACQPSSRATHHPAAHRHWSSNGTMTLPGLNYFSAKF